jgi:uncharacterized protein YjbJ (UPF0337 family)
MADQGRCSCLDNPLKIRELIMNKEGIQGATQKGVGEVKDAVGKATGNDRLRAEGLGDKAVGSAKEAVGKVKDAVHKASR